MIMGAFCVLEKRQSNIPTRLSFVLDSSKLLKQY